MGDSLGEALRRMRELVGLTGNDVARRQERYEKLDQSRISAVETGRNPRPGHELLLAILEGIGLPADQWPPVVRLNVLRGELDEREVGMEAALGRLSLIERAEARAREVFPEAFAQQPPSPLPAAAQRSGTRRGDASA